MANKKKAEENFSRPQCCYFTILQKYNLKKVAHFSKAFFFLSASQPIVGLYLQPFRGL